MTLAGLKRRLDRVERASADVAVTQRYYGLPDAAEYEADRLAAKRLHESGLMSNEEAVRLLQRLHIRIESDRMEHERKAKRWRQS